MQMKNDLDSILKATASSIGEKNAHMEVGEKVCDSLEALFIPLQSNDPVEQLVRRT